LLRSSLGIPNASTAHMAYTPWLLATSAVVQRVRVTLDLPVHWKVKGKGGDRAHR